MSGAATRRHIDSTPALRALMAAVTGVPVEWGSEPDAMGGHFCERCSTDYDACPGTDGEHDVCPRVCADCRARDGFTCAGCGWDLPDAETAGELCAQCETLANMDDHDEYEYRRDA